MLDLLSWYKNRRIGDLYDYKYINWVWCSFWCRFGNL
jgi:hypothetical protein